ncbi:MAG: FAD binding domain-containing protein [Eubacteriales bacterium]|nr:FAD binding domain-containing protein [Eubacteriales bacterium]
MNNKIYKPFNLVEALRMRADFDIVPYAGGTDLMVSSETPSFLFIGDLQELQDIYYDDKGLHIGPCINYTELLHHYLCPELLQETIRKLAAPAIRNQGTIGGNICNASPAGDTLPVLLLYDTKLVLQSTQRQRTVLLNDFIAGRKQIDLRSDELLVDIILQKKGFNSTYYHKIGSRKAMTISKTAVAAAATIDNDKVVEIGIAFASMYKTPLRFPEIEQGMTGLSLEDLALNRSVFVEQYSKLLLPISDVRSTAEYRKNATLNLVDDFLQNISK